jgi:hypothetical protein
MMKNSPTTSLKKPKSADFILFITRCFDGMNQHVSLSYKLPLFPCIMTGLCWVLMAKKL